jgi:5-methylcytosine-specific restriction enzyme subunit McrC
MKKGRLHAGEVVGCIQVGSVRINILPKLDTVEDHRDKDFLLNILYCAGYLSSSFARAAQVRASARDPLEAIISEVANVIAAGIQSGVPRRYEERREESTLLRGRIDFTQVSTRLPAGRVSLPVRHVPLTVNNSLARCIKWIATTLFRVTRSSASRQALAGILGQLITVDLRGVSMAQFDEIKLSKYEESWAHPLALGRLLLTGRFPDPTYGGNHQALSMLFPLQHLFERALRRVLSDTLRDDGVHVTHHSEPLFLLEDSDTGKGVVRLKPDFLLKPRLGLMSIADAKWKRANESQRVFGVTREDLYQMNAYLSRYEAKKSIVFMPQASWMDSRWAKTYDVPESEKKVILIGTDIEGLVSHKQAIRLASQRELALTLREVMNA